jgi:hypothetical protein
MFKFLMITSVYASNFFGVRESVVKINMPWEYQLRQKPIQLPEIRGKDVINIMLYASSLTTSYAVVRQIPENCIDVFEHYKSLGHSVSFVALPPGTSMHSRQMGATASCTIKVVPCARLNLSNHCAEPYEQEALFVSPL